LRPQHKPRAAIFGHQRAPFGNLTMPQLLQRCTDADPGCRSEPTYVRFYGLSRRGAA
jgi:hypothetical protein